MASSESGAEVLLGKRYSCVLIDAPKSYIGSRVGHPPYDVMTREQINALPIKNLVGRRGVVFSWTSAPKLAESIDNLRSWGFRFTTCVPWVKTAISSKSLHFGLGYWTRNTTEFLLIGQRGKPRRKTLDQYGLLHRADHPVFFAPRTRHSEKPATVHSWIDEIIEGPKIEIFARTERGGLWTCIGHDLGSHVCNEGFFVWPRSKNLGERVSKLLLDGVPVEKILPMMTTAEPSERERLLAEATILERVRQIAPA